MGIRYKHLCDICSRDATGEKFYFILGRLCSRCFRAYVHTLVPNYIPPVQNLAYCIEKLRRKYGHEIQREKEVLLNVQTLENGLDG